MKLGEGCWQSYCNVSAKFHGKWMTADCRMHTRAMLVSPNQCSCPPSLLLLPLPHTSLPSYYAGWHWGVLDSLWMSLVEGHDLLLRMLKLVGRLPRVFRG